MKPCLIQVKEKHSWESKLHRVLWCLVKTANKIEKKKILPTPSLKHHLSELEICTSCEQFSSFYILDLFWHVNPITRLYLYMCIRCFVWSALIVSTAYPGPLLMNATFKDKKRATENRFRQLWIELARLQRGSLNGISNNETKALF